MGALCSFMRVGKLTASRMTLYDLEAGSCNTLCCELESSVLSRTCVWKVLSSWQSSDVVEALEGEDAGRWLGHWRP